MHTTYTGHQVIDEHGEPVGTVSDVFYDDADVDRAHARRRSGGLPQGAAEADRRFVRDRRGQDRRSLRPEVDQAGTSSSMRTTTWTTSSPARRAALPDHLSASPPGLVITRTALVGVPVRRNGNPGQNASVPA
ncbi:MAG: hypothetical protein R2713_23965 [Ilumatobacteraceae bacterium]